MATTLEQVARIVRDCLERGGTVQIDGLGAFHPGAGGGFSFVPQTRPTVFLAYVVEDAAPACRLCDALLDAGFDPWLDRRRLLPGQNWPRSIEHAISTCDFFMACFSRRACRKRGGFQSELRYALDCARRLPLEDVFLIPVRLEDCVVPVHITREYQYVDLFPDWDKGLARVLQVMRGVQASAQCRAHPTASR